jgi:hypothetical protein
MFFWKFQERVVLYSSKSGMPVTYFLWSAWKNWNYRPETSQFFKYASYKKFRTQKIIGTIIKIVSTITIQCLGFGTFPLTTKQWNEFILSVPRIKSTLWGRKRFQYKNNKACQKSYTGSKIFTPSLVPRYTKFQTMHTCIIIWIKHGFYGLMTEDYKLKLNNNYTFYPQQILYMISNAKSKRKVSLVQ